MEDTAVAMEGNGFRSLQLVLSAAMKQVEDMAVFVTETATAGSKKQKRLSRSGGGSGSNGGSGASSRSKAKEALEHLRNYGTHVLGTLVRLVDMAVRLGDALQPGEIFLPHSHPLTASMLEESKRLRRETFYGSTMAFYYQEDVRIHLKTVGLAMASFSVRYGGTRLRPRPSGIITSLYKTSIFFFSPTEKAKTLADATESGSIEFTKAFWNLTESIPGLNQLIKLGTNGLAVNRVLSLPLTLDQLEREHSASNFSLGGDTLLTSRTTAEDELTNASSPWGGSVIGVGGGGSGDVMSGEVSVTFELVDGVAMAEEETTSGSETSGCATNGEEEGGDPAATTYSGDSTIINGGISGKRVGEWVLVTEEERSTNEPGSLSSTSGDKAAQLAESAEARITAATDFSSTNVTKATSPSSSSPPPPPPPPPSHSHSPTSSASSLAAAPNVADLMRGRGHDQRSSDDWILEQDLAGEGLHVRARLLSYKLINGQVSEATENRGTAKGGPISSALIVHFHGGGFVAHSSKSHEIYLRIWAKKLRVPILSIDYSLSPEAVYPTAVHECLFAYRWALANADKLGWTGERVVLAGDSAGGKLAFAVGLRCAHDKLRVPDAIVAFYPALELRLALSPSRLLASIDALLPLGVLLNCIEAYTGRRQGATTDDPFLCPIAAPNQLLKALKDVHIVASGFDPLLDDSVGMVNRLRAVGAEPHFEILTRMPHGFLNLPARGPALSEAHRVALDTMQRALSLSRPFEKANWG